VQPQNPPKTQNPKPQTLNPGANAVNEEEPERDRATQV